MTSLPEGARLWVQLHKDGYVQQCAAWAIISGNLTLDVALVSRANLTASTMPSGPGLRSVSGTVVEMTATGPHPVASVEVDAAAGDTLDGAPSEGPAAYTYSDAAGRFALCGLPVNDRVCLEAGAGTRFDAFACVAPGQTGDVEIKVP
jgi:hypothetical protein